MRAMPSSRARHQREHKTLGEDRREHRGSQVNGHCPCLLFLTGEQELLEHPQRKFSSFTLAVSARGPWLNPKRRSQEPSDMGELEESSSEWHAVGWLARCRVGPRPFWQAATYGDTRNNLLHHSEALPEPPCRG